MPGVGGERVGAVLIVRHFIVVDVELGFRLVVPPCLAGGEIIGERAEWDVLGIRCSSHGRAGGHALLEHGVRDRDVLGDGRCYLIAYA